MLFRSPTGMLWSLADRLGSIDLLTDKDGNVVDKRTFDSFGRVLSETNPSVSFRYGYTGRERDLESGLDYYRARYYDSNVGRFISVDPMGFDAGDTNLYRYVGNGATNHTDPSGMIFGIDDLIVIGGIALIGGAIIGAYQNYSQQQAQIDDHQMSSDGRMKTSIDSFQVAASGAWGAVGAVAGLAAITVAPQIAIPTFAVLGTGSAINNHFEAQKAFDAGQKNTAEHLEKMAFLDLLGVGFLGMKPPSSTSMSFASGASALGAAVPSLPSGVGAGLIGAGVVNDAKDIFQHFFGAKTEEPREPLNGEKIIEQNVKDPGHPDVGRNYEWQGDGNPPKWADPSNSKAYRHTVKDHSAKKKPDKLWGRAFGKKGDQGQFLNDLDIVELEKVTPTKPGVYVIELNRSIGRVYKYNADNSREIISDVNRVFVKRHKDGAINGYPVDGDFKLNKENTNE